MRSIEHDTLGEMALTWLAARCGSFRGACEVQVGPGYVADAACLAVMYHSEFERRCREWGLATDVIVYDCGDLGKLPGGGEGLIPDYFSCVFESKATRADFLSTFGGRNNKHTNRREPAAHLHWIVVEKNVCDPAEVPGHWGLLQRRGRGLSELKPAQYMPRTEMQALHLANRLLWKPDYKRIRLAYCPECLGPLDERQPTHWNALEPKHLMGDDPARNVNPKAVPA